ncbi:MAG TPA: FAD-dependent oxidoreductase, partial [Vicinamibacterales bacterium]|nr:FAD-dependent oxidoreductase [Vicinamibacterales bacterium]
MPQLVVVVGAGVFGTWTAHHLLAAGCDVTLVDAYGPANPRASSSDQSRILRCGYGTDEIYSQFARRSIEQWTALQERAGVPIWHPCGVLLLAEAADPYVIATRHTLERGGYGVDVLEPSRLRDRYPHLEAGDVSMALLEPDCGVLMARRAVRALAAELARAGARLLRGKAVVTTTSGTLRSIGLAGGGEISGDAFVFACGPWLPSVLVPSLSPLIRPTRQTVVYFGTPAGDDRFGHAHTPAWIDRPAGIFGIPELEDAGLKVGIDEHGPPIDPDTDDRTPAPEAIARARAWVERRFPAMRGAPVIGTRICQYENTSNGDLLIDRHPDYDNIWVVGG